jgi:hypothetical protein
MQICVAREQHVLPPQQNWSAVQHAEPHGSQHRPSTHCWAGPQQTPLQHLPGGQHTPLQQSNVLGQQTFPQPRSLGGQHTPSEQVKPSGQHCPLQHCPVGQQNPLQHSDPCGQHTPLHGRCPVKQMHSRPTQLAPVGQHTPKQHCSGRQQPDAIRHSGGGQTHSPLRHTSPGPHCPSLRHAPATHRPCTHRCPSGQQVVRHGEVPRGQSWQVAPPTQIWPNWQVLLPQGNPSLAGITQRPPEQTRPASQQMPSQQVRFSGQQLFPHGAWPEGHG